MATNGAPALPRAVPTNRSRTAVFGSVALLGIAFIAWQVDVASGIGFSAAGLSNIGQVLAPVVLISLFIERATEVVITSWRSPNVQRMQHDLDLAAGDSQVAQQRVLNFYRLETQRLAFILSFSLAVVSALIGLRVVQPLLDPTTIAELARSGSAQWTALTRLDILLTGLLLAGGADGIHKVVTTFNAFIDSTRNRLSAAGDPNERHAPRPQSAAPVQQRGE